MPAFTADWILPIADEPLPRGFVTVENSRIVAVGATPPSNATDLGRVAILPGLVNAHTHLELSYLHGRVPPAGRFTDWVQQLMDLRRQFPDPAAAEIVDAAAAALTSARRAGTALFGDVSNTLISVPLLHEARVPGQVFYELLGFNIEDAAGRVAQARTKVNELSRGEVRVGLAPHAPYSVAPALFAALRADLDAQPRPVTSVHLGESSDEIEFVRDGTGPLRGLLEQLGVWAAHAELPSGLSSVGYLSNLGFLDRCVMVVHGVQFEGADLNELATLGITIASCPRSNRYVGAGDPPLEAFYAMDVDVAFGTDSLASAPDLNLFSELKEARRLARRVPARRLLESATLVGAQALGFGDDYGSLEPGKRAAMIAVRIPAGVSDVEEYLVGGIEPEAVSWVS